MESVTQTKDFSIKLANAPIVEAVVDIRCDMPPGLDLAALESQASELFREPYSKPRKQYIQVHQFEQKGSEPPTVSAGQGLQALQFLNADGRQLVQVRITGFSFNRLAPYTTLDDYLPEIERTWGIFVGLVAPVKVKQIRLRYINRIMLPLVDGSVEFSDYLKVSPRLPDEDKLRFVGFLNHHTALDVDTGNLVNIILTMQPKENDHLPLIFDIEAWNASPAEPNDWSGIVAKIESLRSLKNRIFKNTLTERCLNLF